MPTYEYQCLKCGKNFDVFQSMKDDAFKTCPEAQCQMTPWGKGEVKRMLGTGAGLIFKGSGFYITDYRSEGYKQSAKKDTTSSSTPAESGTGKETKPPSSNAKGSGTGAGTSTKSTGDK